MPYASLPQCCNIRVHALNLFAQKIYLYMTSIKEDSKNIHTSEQLTNKRMFSCKECEVKLKLISTSPTVFLHYQSQDQGEISHPYASAKINYKVSQNP